MHRKILYKTALLFIVSVHFNCTEPLPLVTENFEEVLVIEATITNELKTQQIKVSRTVALEDSIPNYVTNANVVVEGSNNLVHNFQYTGLGIYNSVDEFQAEAGISYTLVITDENGKRYSSNSEVLPPKVEIDRVYAERIVKGNDTGIQVLVDSETSLNGARYFRYEYEETYQIIAEYFNLQDIEFISTMGSGPNFFFEHELVPRPFEQQVCYSSNASNEIIITNINGLAENRVSQFPVRFIKADNTIIRDRYSILVKQFVQSAEANNFYEILKDLSSDESLLIDNQPGFVQGNIVSEQRPDEKVIGFFDVSPVSYKRIFFDHDDFDLDKPDYFYDCEILEFQAGPFANPNEGELFYQLITNNNFKFFGLEPSIGTFPGIFRLVQPECGDCTTFASGERPEFWID